MMLQLFRHLFLEKFDPKQYWICQEWHEGTEGLHFHVLAVFDQKLDTRNVRYFDIEGYHPNIQVPKKFAKVKAYVCKAGRFLHNERLDYSSFKGFEKRLRDYNTWKRSVDPGSNYSGLFEWCGVSLRLYGLNEEFTKKRSLWIVGPPNCGKTYGFYKVASANMLPVFTVPHTKYPFEGYADQQIVLYDDHFPSFIHLCNILQVYLHGYSSHVAGESRYVEKFWPTQGEPGGIRNIVVLANNFPDYGSHRAAFHARFVVYVAVEFDDDDFAIKYELVDPSDFRMP